LALLLTGSIDILRSLLLLLAQIAGGVAASALALGLFQTTASVRTSLPETTSIPRGVFIEAILTAQLVLSVLMLAKRDQRAVCIAPLGIGLALFMGELVGIYHTGGSLNPARSFGPNAVSWTWEATHWVYWAGPCIGSLIAAVIHTMFMTSENDVREGGLEANAHKEPQNPYRAVRA
jgi:aquaporin related protein